MAEKIDLTMFPTDLNCLVKLLKNKISYMANILEISNDCKDVLESMQKFLWVYESSPHAALDSYIKTKKDGESVNSMEINKMSD